MIKALIFDCFGVFWRHRFVHLFQAAQRW